MSPIFYLFWMVSHVTALMGYIYVLLRVFRYAGVVAGMVGVVFSPYVYVWGWLRSDLRPVMLVWSGALALALTLDALWLAPVL